MKKTLIVILGCLIILSMFSIVVVYTYTDSSNTEQDYMEGVLMPEPQNNIIRWSNPRYRNGTMINWAVNYET